MEFMETLLSVQPRMIADKGDTNTPDQIVLKIAKDIEGRVPALLVARKEDATGTSLQVFRSQEVDRFNKLVKVIKSSLALIQKAIQGLVVMSIELEMMFSSFMNQKVPENWENAAYPSLKPLGSWVNDMIERLVFFKKWLEEGEL
jgi:dynein heavy chain